MGNLVGVEVIHNGKGFRIMFEVNGQKIVLYPHEAETFVRLISNALQRLREKGG